MEVKSRGFKRKTIISNIEDKLSKWIKTIENQELKEKILDSVVVTGGSIASMLQGELPNDYDIYFKDVDIALKCVEYYLDKLPKNENDKVRTQEARLRSDSTGIEIFIKSAGVAGENISQTGYQYFEWSPEGSSSKYLDQIASKENGKFEVAYMTSNAITLTDNLQIIIRFCGEPMEIHKNFDFVHCTNWWTKSEGLVLNRHALESILAKELRYIGSRFPVSTMFRLKKFIQRGWTITAGEMFKIAYDISKLDLTDISVLQEQLTGVDQAYFNEVISELNKEENRNLDRTYLFELITRVFDGS